MTRLQKLVLLAVTFAAASSVVAAETYEDRWNGVVKEHFRLIKNEPGKSYEAELTKVHNTFWRGVYQQCVAQAKAENVQSFLAAAVVGPDGVVREFLTMPKSSNFDCFKRAMVGKQYPKPPTAPFYEVFRIALPRRDGA